MLRVPSTISKITTMADGGLRLQVDTQELASDDKAVLMAEYNKLGHFVFASEGVIKEADIPTTPLEDNQKTPSQRLRSVVFAYWKKALDKGGLTKEELKRFDTDFEGFYRIQVEKYIDHIKKKIDEL